MIHSNAPTEPGRGAIARPGNNFNFIRLLLATMVIVSHSPELVDGDAHRELLHLLMPRDPGMTSGGLAVRGFFLLSGFLILQSWSREPRLFAYLNKRARRIYPGFIVASILSAALVGPFAGNSNYWAEFPWLGFLENLALLQLPLVPPVFQGLHYAILNGPLWTIQFEFSCYLILAGLGVIGVLRRPRALLAFTVVALLANVAGLIGYFNISKVPWLIQFHMLHLPELVPYFLVGACFATYRDRIRFTVRGVCIAAPALFVAMFHRTSAELALPILGGYLLFAAAFAPSRRLRDFGRGPDISYGVYLYAWPIQSLIIDSYRDIDPTLLTAITIPISYLLGLASWHLVEKHFLRHKSAGRPSPGSAAIAPPVGPGSRRYAETALRMPTPPAC